MAAGRPATTSRRVSLQMTELVKNDVMVDGSAHNGLLLARSNW